MSGTTSSASCSSWLSLCSSLTQNLRVNQLLPNYDGALSSSESENPYPSLTGDPGKACLLLESHAHSIATLLALLGGHCSLHLSVLIWGDGSFTPVCRLRASAFCNSGRPPSWLAFQIRRNILRLGMHYCMDPLASWLGAGGFAQPAKAPGRQRTCLDIAKGRALQISAC